MNLKRNALLIVIVPLVWLMAQAVIAGYGYVIQYRANSAIDSWQKQVSSPPVETWNAIERSVSRAISMKDGQPDLINVMGRLNDFYAFRMSSSQEEKNTYQQHAQACYRQVMKLRPAWPYGYMNLVQIKARAGEWDAEYYDLLVKLSEIAPWEDKTLPALIQMMTFSWAFMTAEKQAMLRPYLKQAATVRGRDVKAALQKGNRVSFFCSNIVEGEPSVVCSGVGKPKTRPKTS